MMPRSLLWLSIVLTLVTVKGWAFGQAPNPPAPAAPAAGAQPTDPKDPPAEPKKPVPLPPPPADAVAATVNGVDIPEIAVYRGMLRGPMTPEARKEVVHYLIDNMVVDHYLVQLKIEADAKEVDNRFNEIKEEAVKNKQDFDELMKKLHLTQDELRKELVAALRWDKFVNQQGTDKVLRDFYEKNTVMFDGSQIQARHILIKGDAAQAQTQIVALRKAVDDEAAKAVAALPADADNLTKEKTRIAATLKAFGELAAKNSDCPSKSQGGDLGWFPRAGAMVEPFARAAFALKPTQMSEPVSTEFGHHLILCVDTKPGRAVKFEDIRPFVLEIYGDRLREAVLTAYKSRSKITVNELKK